VSADLATRAREVLERITAAAADAGRRPEEVRLLSVSKTFPAERVVEAARAGLIAFGENRVQEASDKIPAVQSMWPDPLEWHLVGPLQRNKARRAAELFDCVHSVDRPELATALDRARARTDEDGERLLDILLQVNIDEEPQKSGVLPGDAARLLDATIDLQHLRVVGLMAIPRAQEDAEQSRAAFARMRELRAELRDRRGGETLHELSMGMSSDYEVAIQEGATWVRVGTAIFGSRGAATAPADVDREETK